MRTPNEFPLGQLRRFQTTRGSKSPFSVDSVGDLPWIMEFYASSEWEGHAAVVGEVCMIVENDGDDLPSGVSIILAPDGRLHKAEHHTLRSFSSVV